MSTGSPLNPWYAPVRPWGSEGSGGELHHGGADPDGHHDTGEVRTAVVKQPHHIAIG